MGASLVLSGSVYVHGQSLSSAYIDVNGLEAVNLTGSGEWTAYYREAPVLIAVSAVRYLNDYDINGISVEVSIGSLSTDESWKCTNSEEADWYKPSFKDSHWENASVVGTYNGLDKWISATTDDDSTQVYCRHVMGEYRTKTEYSDITEN